MSKSERAEAARRAAEVRWISRSSFEREPKKPEEVTAFVAHGDSRVDSNLSKMVTSVCFKALGLLRGDPCLARMMPVFLWRNRRALEQRSCTGLSGEKGRLLGYLLATTARISGHRGFSGLILALGSRRPLKTREKMLFVKASKNPFEVMKATMNPSREALSWGFIVGDTSQFFEPYFEKMRTSW